MDHPDPHQMKKQFKEYFLEFLMIFLAVALGFFAENVREHLGDRSREKEYILAMVEDMKADTANIHAHAVYRNDRRRRLDSLSLLLRMPDYNARSGLIYYYGRWVERTSYFNITDPTLQELNTGGMHLITRPPAVKAIMEYYTQAKVVKIQASSLEDETVVHYIHLINFIFDGNVMDEMYQDSLLVKPRGNPPFLTNDRQKFNELISQVHQVKSLNSRNLYFENKLKIQAMRAMRILKREYQLE
jgi:hypothetical protein